MTLIEFKDYWIKNYFPSMNWSQYEDWCDNNAIYPSEMLYDEVTTAFAKYHVKQALKAAYDKLEYTTENSSERYVIEESILNSYSFKNIK